MTAGKTAGTSERRRESVKGEMVMLYIKTKSSYNRDTTCNSGLRPQTDFFMPKKG